MLKAWSISTTVRNPERLRDFLVALQPLVGKEWNHENQENYQKILIKKRLYGFGNTQFYNGLPPEIVALVNDVDNEIDDDTIDRIIKIKNYRDFSMRGRQSINPLTKFGFALNDSGVIKITALGRKLIESEKDSGDAFLRSFIKWQIPNTASNDYSDDGTYDIVPFVGTLKLINEVNRLESERGKKSKGISKREFSLFVPSLVNHVDITKYAQKIVHLRNLQMNKTKPERKIIRDNFRNSFAVSFLGTDDTRKIEQLLDNLKDYGDNTIRYFRLTKFIRIRGNGFYIDLEPSRRTEIESLLESGFYKSRSFRDKSEYLRYMSDDSLPGLPWQTKDKLQEIISGIHLEINELEESLGSIHSQLQNLEHMNETELVAYADELRILRKDLQEKNNHVKSQPIESINDYIEKLQNIYTSENRALALEHLSTLGLHALNDAIEIKPNYPVGDDNQPTSTAPGGMADIECFYDSFNMICEVTMLNGRDQWYNEGQPVMRHLRDFENKHNNSYCLFVAPNIHTDSAETFWTANIHGYKGVKQKIAPISISQFVKVLQTLKLIRESGKSFKHSQLEDLLKSICIATQSTANSDEWIAKNDQVVDLWSAQVLAA
jgi:hypothetical protein